MMNEPTSMDAVIEEVPSARARPHALTGPIVEDMRGREFIALGSMIALAMMADMNIAEYTLTREKWDTIMDKLGLDFHTRVVTDPYESRADFSLWNQMKFQIVRTVPASWNELDEEKVV